MKIRNIYLGIKYQLPLRRLIKNVWSGNIVGALYKRSHFNANGKPKISYSSFESASKAARKMEAKTGKHFSVYKCFHCDGFHIGKNRDNV